MNATIAVIAGDGIGREVTDATQSVLNAVAEKYNHSFTFVPVLAGGAAIDECGCSLPQQSLDVCKSCDSVLLGALGGPKWDSCTDRPEKALLALRKELGLYANIRPAKFYPALTEQSPLKDGVLRRGGSERLPDFVIVRELTGGMYFGERGMRNGKSGREAYDVECYSELEIERIGRWAYELAMTRGNHLTLVDKANVLLSSALWRKIIHDINEDYPSVRVDDMYVDNCAMQIVINPLQFDVIVTSNMFGDILSDLAGALCGSIGVMPSASLGATTVGMYEAIHGAANDIAGLNVANPIGTILSAAMMLRLSFNLSREAQAIEQAVEKVLSAGFGTSDLHTAEDKKCSTTLLTEKIIEQL